MCTSSERHRSRSVGGFTAMELILGTALALLLVTSIAPLWISLENSGVRGADRVIKVMQGRVAVARLERDLRLATGGGCLFSTSGALLDATSDQVVFLSRSVDSDAETPMLVEWEISSGRLMRRWGGCPSSRPLVFAHSLYVDHKTMLEGVASASEFCYVIGGQVRRGVVPKGDLALVEAVMLHVGVRDDSAILQSGPSTIAPVGR
jgi:hypothetical protein